MEPSVAGSTLLWLGLSACFVFWTLVFARRRRGQPVLPVAPRRSVPWRGLDLVLIVAVWLLCMDGMGAIGDYVFGSVPRHPPAAEGAQELNTTHELIRLVEHGGPWVVALAVFVAVVLAPVWEEVFFRLLFQGWLESVDRRFGRSLRSMVRWGTLPVVVVAILFAAIHSRFPSPPRSPEVMTFQLLRLVVVSLVTLVFALGWVRVVRGATAEDLGLVRGRILADVRMGMVLFAGIAAPLYLAQIALSLLLAKHFSPDPITLFPFALALGTLYCRTHRIVPSMALHMSLNASAFLLLWLLNG